MKEFSLNKEPDLIVTARFIEKGADNPLTGDDYMIRLYDRDIADDDYLGQSRLDEEGRIRIEFSHDAFVNDSVFKEAKPDFFFVIMKNEVPVFTSKVLQDISLEDIEQFRMGVGEVVNLGTFLVDVN
jgi:hypothetical protein